MELVLETRQRDEHSCCAAGASLSDLHADVCSQPDTHPALMGISKSNPVCIVSEAFPSQCEHDPSDLSSVGCDKA
jgi:hypothetical protein